MFRVEIKEEVNLRTFLTLSDSEYFDAILDKGNSTFIISNSEVFATITLETVAIDEKGSQAIRLPRKLLLNLLSVGYLLIDVKEVDVNLELYEIQKENSVEKTCGLLFARQQIWAEGYTDRLKLISELSTKTMYDLSSLTDIIKIGSTNKSIITCDRGVVCTALGNNCRVYRKIDSSINFSINANTLAILTRISPKVFDYKNYLGVIKDSLTIICTKVRHSSNEEYALIIQEKSSFKANVDLHYLQRFLSKMHLSNDTVQVDLLQSNSVITDGSKQYTIPIMVKNLQKAESCKECKFNINAQILDIVNKTFNHNIVAMSNKRTFVQLDSNETSLIFRG